MFRATHRPSSAAHKNCNCSLGPSHTSLASGRCDGSTNSNIISKRFKICPKLFVATVQFCKWFRKVVCSDDVDSLLSYITDEIIRTVKQMLKPTYWSVESPRIIHEVALHDITVGVWCAISATRKI
jgi:hypothetical protein